MQYLGVFGYKSGAKLWHAHFSAAKNRESNRLKTYNMLAYKLSLVVVLALLGAAHAQVIAGGTCPKNITVQSNFSVEDYLGIWYEYSKYPLVWERNGKCITAKYSEQCDGNVNVYNTLVNKETGKEEDIEGYAKVVDGAKLLVIFPGSPSYPVDTNYWVLSTDYKSFAVVYACQPISKFVHSSFVWILTRKRIPCEQTIVRAEHVLHSQGISTKDLTMTDQAGCH